MPRKTIPQPWHSFLTELTAGATEELILPCLGGFVVTLLYGLERPTADVDVLAIFPSAAGPEWLARAGKNSPWHRQYGLYLNLGDGRDAAGGLRTAFDRDVPRSYS